MNMIESCKARRNKGQAGFTLVEIAIVLVIIGLLIGGIIKGQAMIQNAKVKRLVSDVEGLRAAILTYQDRYNMLPGDENDANSPPGDTANGNNNGRLDETDGTELQDMRLAGILTGTGTTLIRTSFGGTLRADWIAIGGLTGNFIVATRIPAEIAQEIDTKYDDGTYNAGSIRGSAAYTTGTIIANFGWQM